MAMHVEPRWCIHGSLEAECATCAYERRAIETFMDRHDPFRPNWSYLFEGLEPEPQKPSQDEREPRC